MLCKLRHTNIVPILAVCLDTPACIVYPYKVNKSVQHHLNDVHRRQALSSSTRLSIMADVAAGIAYLHEQVHHVACSIKVLTMLY
jgi:serine/threonine protein kinase